MLRRLASTHRLAALLLLGGLACDARVEPRAAASVPRSDPAPTPPPAPPPAPAPASDVAYLEFIHVPPGTPPTSVPAPGTGCRCWS